MHEMLGKVARFRGVASITAVHGTRLSDPGLLHREGISPSGWSRRERLLEETIARRNLPEVAASSLRAELTRRRAKDNDIDTGKWFAMLDSRVLVQHRGHYVLLGSEWLAGLLCQCGVPWKAEVYPTVYSLAVPLGAIPDYSTDALAKDLVREWVRLKTLQRRTIRELDHTLILHTPLPSDCVVSHYHPSRILNPHRGFSRVRNTRTVCPACQTASRRLTRS